MLAEHCGDFFAGQGFQADESVGVLLLVVTQDFSRAVERDARIAFHIHDTGNLYPRRRLEGVTIAPQTLLEVGLLGYGEDDDVPLAVQFLGQSLAANLPRAIVIGTDKKE